MLVWSTKYLRVGGVRNRALLSKEDLLTGPVLADSHLMLCLLMELFLFQIYSIFISFHRVSLESF